jgi:formylglycine-generating enzyme required for sulfatase activity
MKKYLQCPSPRPSELRSPGLKGEESIHPATRAVSGRWRERLLVAGIAALMAYQLVEAQVPISSSLSLESNMVVLTWNAEPGSHYSILTSPSLDLPFAALTPTPLLSPLNQVTLREPTGGQNRFFQVAQVDVVAPAVWGPSPTDKGVAVSRRATIEVPIYDDGIIDTNSISFTLTNGPPLRLGDPRLSFSDGLLVFTPGPGDVLGDFGQVVTVAISAADIFGNALNNIQWSFRLEQPPIIQPNVTAVNNVAGGLMLLSTNAAGNTFVYSFAGETSGLTPNMILVSADPGFIYRRTVLTVSEDLVNHTVTVETAEASLADCFQQSSVQFTGDLTAGDLRLASAGAEFAPAGAPSCCSLVFDGTNVISSADFVAEIIRGRFVAKPRVNVRGQFGAQGLQSADFEMRQTLALDLSFRAEAHAAGAYTNRVALGSSVQRLPIELVGFVPAWADATLEFTLGFEGLWQGPGIIMAGVKSTNRFALASQFRDGTWSNQVYRTFRYDVVTPTWQTNLDAEARVYLEVKVQLDLDGLAGPQWLTRPALHAIGSTYAPPGFAGSDVFLYDEFLATAVLDLSSWDSAVPSALVRALDGHDLIHHRTETVPIPVPIGALVQPLPNMVWIPPGKFQMGEGLTSAAPAECACPLTQVNLSEGFFMSRYEVTQREYFEVTGLNPSVHHGGIWGTNLNRPVENIFWDRATNYCGELTARERLAGRIPYNFAYRLPTEAEWEYACRGGTTNRFHFGEVLRGGLANFDCRSNAVDACASNPVLTVVAPSTSSDPQPVAVGQFAGNAWGLHDLHGNVREWCLDWLGTNLPGGTVADPRGPAAAPFHAIRGGGYEDNDTNCQAHFRSSLSPGAASPDVGFRILLASSPPGPESYSIELPSGFTLIANQLENGGNTLNEVLTLPPAKMEAQIFKWNATLQNYDQPALFDGIMWIDNSGDPSTITLSPGEGAVLFVPENAGGGLHTFSGIRRQTTTPPTLVSGWQIISRQVPEPGNYETIVQRPPVEGVMVQRYLVDGVNVFTTTFTNGTWRPSVPTARKGEAWFLYLP